MLRPRAVDGGDDFTVTETAEGWRVRGEKPERWVRQTDFSNDEAVGFLADRLNRLGVEEQLLELGAEEGDAVLIGDEDNAVVFDFKPMMEAGAEILGRRGEDTRFEESRPAARRRRAIQEAMATRAPGETRADVARRLGVTEADVDAAAAELGDESPEDWGWSEDDSRNDILNVNGSGISLGHPIGATGGRILASMLYELERRQGRYAMETMCIGGGQGIAAIFERAA